jgi:hypothetical protein
MTSARKADRRRPRHKRNRAYEYVGRFLWSFANVVGGVEELFSCKYNLDSFSSLLMQHNLDIRKKIELLKFAFERQQVKNIKTIQRTLDQVHRFHDIRNAIAHSGFNHVPPFTRVESVRFQQPHPPHLSTLQVRRVMHISCPLKADKHGRHQRRSTH